MPKQVKAGRKTEALPDTPPLPPLDYKDWPKTADATEEIAVAFEIMASALVAIAYDVRQIRLTLAGRPPGPGEAPSQPPARKKPTH